MTEATTKLPPPPRVTIIEVIYPAGRGEIGLRGNHKPLSWNHTEKPVRVEGDRHIFHVPIPPHAVLELKVVRGDDWAAGRNYAAHAGDNLCIEPYFDQTEPTVARNLSLGEGEAALVFDVLLPPSYEEQTAKRYSTLYALDGQSLWSESEDPFGVWGLEGVLGSMFELGAIEELIVVGVHTDVDRAERLSPVRDAQEKMGGGGPAFLKRIVDELRPQIDSKFRTRSGPANTGILGSSMGGLFAFHAAWTRPDVFGKAACLSSSFWWADRYAVRMVQEQDLPEPRPHFYLDTGASPNAQERDVNLRDGFHHTRSMLRALTARGFTTGQDVHRLVWPGQTHDAASWASRVAVPLQLLFPAEVRTAEG